MTYCQEVCFKHKRTIQDIMQIRNILKIITWAQPSKISQCCNLTNWRKDKILMTLFVPSFLLLFLKIKEESLPHCDFLLLWVTLHFRSPLKNIQVMNIHSYIHVDLFYITFPKLPKNMRCWKARFVEITWTVQMQYENYNKYCWVSTEAISWLGLISHNISFLDFSCFYHMTHFQQ